MAEDLIDLTRAKYNIPQSSYTTAEDAFLARLITGCSKALRRYCNSRFVDDGTELWEVFSGNGNVVMPLNQMPIASVKRVLTSPTVVWRAKNTSSTVQVASIGIEGLLPSIAGQSSPSMKVRHVVSGTETLNSFALDTAAQTLSTLATSVDSIGTGWDAEVISGYSNWWTKYLSVLQVGLNAKNEWAEFKAHVEGVSEYEADHRRGILYRQSGWVPGYRNYLVEYRAGFASVPEDVEEACAEFVAQLFLLAKRDPGLLQQSGDGFFFMAMISRGYPFLDSIRQLIEPYRIRRI